MYVSPVDARSEENQSTSFSSRTFWSNTQPVIGLSFLELLSFKFEMLHADCETAILAGKGTTETLMILVGQIDVVNAICSACVEQRRRL